MLQIANLYAGYGGQKVLHDVSFSLEEGESLCIIGPNGCGKTTLLRAVAGLMPFDGSVLLDGRPVADYPRRQLARRIALLSQLGQVCFDYNIYDTVMMGRYPYHDGRLLSGNSDLDRSAVEQSLRQLHLWQDRDRNISTLSGGQLQRVFLARLVAQQPDIILLDEPTNHLDLRHQLELVDFLRRQVTCFHCSVVGVLHDINLALRLADRLLLLGEGTVQALGTSDEVLSSDCLQQVYGVDVAGYMRESLARWQ